MTGGVIGIGPSSPIWAIQGTEAEYNEALFDILLPNFNNWTFAQSDWVAISNESYIGFGYDTDTYYDKYDWSNY